MKKYEEEVMHPVRFPMGGGLASAMLIQVSKLFQNAVTCPRSKDLQG